MKIKAKSRILATAVCVLSVLMAATVAFAEIPAADPPTTEGVSHHWVERSMGTLPYTEQTPAEKAAVVAATKALTQPPEGVVRNADHGYTEPARLIALGKSLKASNPTIVGHELLVWNGERAVRVYVNADGSIKMMDAGSPKMLATASTGVADHGDRDAREIALGAAALAKGLDPKAQAPDGAVVSAHAIGFADEDGSHLVVRVDPNGTVSYPTW